GGEELLAAAHAAIGSRRPGLLVLAGKRALGGFLARHLILDRRQLLAPLRLALADFFCHFLNLVLVLLPRSGFERRQRLHLHIFTTALDPAPPSDAALLDPAIGRLAIDALGAVGVDEHVSRLQPPSEIGGARDVLAPDGTSEAVHRRVGAG